MVIKGAFWPNVVTELSCITFWIDWRLFTLQDRIYT